MDCESAKMSDRLRPGQAQARKWLADAVEQYGQQVVASWCGSRRSSVWRWSKGLGRITTGATRWLWMLQAEPWQTRTMFDVLTWGRFAQPPRGWKPKTPQPVVIPRNQSN